MRKQPDINDSMRTILVDWLVEVSEEYRLNGETLYLAVNYIDRFLSFMSVVRAKLQLVGATAILLAAKFEEIYPPEVSEFVYICDGKIDFTIFLPAKLSQNIHFISFHLRYVYETTNFANGKTNIEGFVIRSRLSITAQLSKFVLVHV